VSDLWWGRDNELYATLSARTCLAEEGQALVAPSLWRLDRTQWVQVDRGPVAAVRQLSSATVARLLIDGSLYVSMNGQSVQIASGVVSVEMPPRQVDRGAAVKQRNQVATFVGEWLSRDARLTVRSDGSAQLTAQVGPDGQCVAITTRVEVCRIRARMRARANASGVVLAIVKIEHFDYRGRTVRLTAPDGLVPMAGDDYRMHLADADVVRLFPLIGGSTALRSFYFCRVGTSNAQVVKDCVG
jgi:hypothetical protein